MINNSLVKVQYCVCESTTSLQVKLMFRKKNKLKKTEKNAQTRTKEE